jgi:1-acyl-sn-glycerol-3-phosphate acyltransferase
MIDDSSGSGYDFRQGMPMGKKLARLLINLIITFTARLEVHGIEHMQGLNSFVLASNHIGRLDAILVYRFTNRDDIIMLVAEKYRKNPLARWFVRQLDALFIERFNADFTVLRRVLRRLRDGGVLVLAPEGTRSPTAQLQEAWPGASYLAVKAGVPILPVGLAGSEDSQFFGNLKRLRRTTVSIQIGESFNLTPLQNGDRQSELQNATDEIMCRIAALLPLEYRGVYADHPRLKELLAAP